MFKDTIIKACVILLCGGGLLVLVPVTAAIVADFVKGMKETFKK